MPEMIAAMSRSWPSHALTVKTLYLPRPDGLHHEQAEHHEAGAVDAVFIVEGGEVVAVAYWYLTGTPKDEPGSVSLMVDPEHRGRGHGSRLARYLLDLGADPDRNKYTAAGLRLLRNSQR